MKCVLLFIHFRFVYRSMNNISQIGCIVSVRSMINTINTFLFLSSFQIPVLYASLAAMIRSKILRSTP